MIPFPDTTRKLRDRLTRVYRAICHNPGITSTELNKATQTLSVDERREIIDHLLARGLIVESRILGKGRPTLRYDLAAREESRDYQIGRLSGIEKALALSARAGGQSTQSKWIVEQLEQERDELAWKLSPEQQVSDSLSKLDSGAIALV